MATQAGGGGTSEATSAANQPDLDKHSARAWRPFPTVGWFGRYPQFDAAYLKMALRELGVPWDEKLYGGAVREYRYTRWLHQAGPALSIIGGAGFSACVLATGFVYGGETPIWMGLPALAAMAIFASGLLLTFTRRRVRDTRARFYRLVARAESLLRPRWWRTYSVVAGVNTVGRAARVLFTMLQGSRRTWSSPPAVADRALHLAYPLVNVDLEKAFTESSPQQMANRETYARFVYEVAAVVVTGREDLIPDVRRLYRDKLPLRSDLDGEIPERDALYLDPMRNHSRWAVMKDFLYPLASWLSLIVAVTALVISIVR